MILHFFFSSPESRREKNTTNQLATSQQQQKTTSWFRKPKNSEQSGNPAAASLTVKPQNGESNLIPSTQSQVKSQSLTKALNADPGSKMS